MSFTLTANTGVGVLVYHKAEKQSEIHTIYTEGEQIIPDGVYFKRGVVDGLGQTTDVKVALDCQASHLEMCIHTYVHTYMFMYVLVQKLTR